VPSPEKTAEEHEGVDDAGCRTAAQILNLTKSDTDYDTDSKNQKTPTPPTSLHKQ